VLLVENDPADVRHVREAFDDVPTEMIANAIERFWFRRVSLPPTRL
jgi:hypothetical protein